MSKKGCFVEYDFGGYALVAHSMSAFIVACQNLANSFPPMFSSNVFLPPIFGNQIIDNSFFLIFSAATKKFYHCTLMHDWPLKYPLRESVIMPTYALIYVFIVSALKHISNWQFYSYRN